LYIKSRHKLTFCCVFVFNKQSVLQLYSTKTYRKVGFSEIDSLCHSKRSSVVAK
jgi:hypothetical protein